MKPGKLSPLELRSIVFPRRGTQRREVLVRSGIGQDCAIADLGEGVVVLTSDPITGAGKNAGWLAIHVCCNDIATTGAEAVGALLTLLLSPASPIDDAQRIMSDANRAAGELGIEIVGGHSEITASVVSSIVVVTALGRAGRGRYVTPAGAKPGDTILLTKAAGLEGTAILAADRAPFLSSRISSDDLSRASNYLAEISIVPEARAAHSAGVTAMHDATEGGVLGALAELSAASNHGVEVDLDRIPIRPETRLICNAFGIDPYGLISSGALVIATPSPVAVVDAVRRIGCPIAEIGMVIDGPSRIIRQRASQPLIPPDRDTLWDALARS